MTDPQAASSIDQPVEQLTAAVNERVEAPADLPAANVPAAVTPQQTAEDLPEWEPLSPEIVEDEAIRGDFMLRWAVILLGFLLGCRQIAETQLLVRIRTGEYLAGHGFWPPRSDVFSYTAGDRSWINLGWLFDLLAAGLHGLGGPAVLSGAVGVAVAGLVYWFVNLNRSKLPTWWHAVCAGVLLLALHPQFVPLPKLMSLLGIVWTLRCVLRWSDTKNARSLWCVVGTLMVWANLDAHAVSGWLLLVGYGAGQFVSARLGRRAAIERDERQLWLKVSGAGFVALLLNPFGWHSLLAPWVRFTTELPWMRANYLRISDLGTGSWQSLFDVVSWKAPTPVMIGAAIVVVLAIGTTVMNRRRVDLGLLLSVALVTLLGVMSWEDFSLSLVALAVLAALNGQEWYRDHCRQEYSIATLEVLYSRGGRAVTVIAFGALAYFAISGRLMGRDGTRVGWGWTPQVAANAAGMQDDLRDYKDARFFQFRLDQGDYAIWVGQKVFFDSRVALFARGGENILNLQEQARGTLRTAEGTGAAVSNAMSALKALEDGGPSSGQQIWQRFEITHLTPRLWGQQPGYGALVDVVQSKDWQLEKLGATCAIFGRRTNVKQQDNATALNFERLAFRDCKPAVVSPARVMWPQSQTAYQKFLSLRGTPVSNAGQRARHCIELLQQNQRGRVRLAPTQVLALCFLAIRDAQAAIFEDNANVTAYIALADAYGVLELLESQINAANGGVAAAPQRLFQATAAIHQALLVDPNNIGLRLVLLQKYRSLNRVDAVHAEILKLMTLYKNKTGRTDEDIAVLAQLRELLTQLDPVMERMEKAVAEAQEKSTDTVPLANFAIEQGFPLKALALLEADKLKLASNMQAHLLMAMLMSETGRLEEANTLFEGFDERGGGAEPQFGAWQVQAAYLAKSRGDYDRAIAWARKQRKNLTQTSFDAILGTSPLRSFDMPLVATKALWPTSQVAASEQVLFTVADQAALFDWVAANAQLEVGRCGEANASLKSLLTSNPQSNFAGLAAVYLQMLTDEPLNVSIPGERVPVLFEDGPSDPDEEAAPRK